MFLFFYFFNLGWCSRAWTWTRASSEEESYGCSHPSTSHSREIQETEKNRFLMVAPSDIMIWNLFSLFAYLFATPISQFFGSSLVSSRIRVEYISSLKHVLKPLRDENKVLDFFLKLFLKSWNWKEWILEIIMIKQIAKRRPSTCRPVRKQVGWKTINNSLNTSFRFVEFISSFQSEVGSLHNTWQLHNQGICRGTDRQIDR